MKTVSKINYFFTDKRDKNLAFHVDDILENVLQNHQNLAQKLSYDKTKLIHMKQIHSNIIKILNRDDNFTHPPICDGIITNKLNTPLMVMVADCSPLLLFDAKRRVIAVVHAGRAGAFSNIVKNIIERFTEEFQSLTKDISVIIGPSIKKCCYEVSHEIQKEAEQLNLGYSIKKIESKIYLDITAILLSQLKDAGVPSSNIEISDDCTSCKSDKYFSYRKEKETGRFAGIIELKS